MPGHELFDNEEKKEVEDVLKTGILFRYGFRGKKEKQSKTKKLELELSKKLNIKYTHLCSNGTTALSTSLNTCGIGFGDEVIVPPFTFVATIEAVLSIGATPIFSEIDETLCLCPENIEKKLTKNTKAVIVVHMCGSMAKIEDIKYFCKLKGLILIEDACQALGATYNNKYIGTFGKTGCFSFDFAKTITCGEGGAIVTNSYETYKKIDSYTDHGHNHIGNDRGLETPLTIGRNYRINELNAAIGLAQIRKFDKILKIQKKNKNLIKSAMSTIKKIKFRDIPDIKGDSSTFITFMMPNQEKAKKTIKKLNEYKINGSFYWFQNNWHYINKWDHIKNLISYAKLPLKINKNLLNYDLPKSNYIMKKTISIQIKLNWTDNEIKKLIKKIIQIIENII